MLRAVHDGKLSLSAHSSKAMSSEAVGDAAMEAVDGRSRYSLMIDLVIGAGLHAQIPFATLAGVLLDGAIAAEVNLPVEGMVLSNSLIFAAWIPGALLGGEVSDAVGRKPACVGFSLLSTLAMVAMALLPSGSESSEALLCGARVVNGFGIGAFMAPAYALLLESRAKSAKGAGSFAWSLGYVVAISIFASIHLGATSEAVAAVLPAFGLSAWRLEQLLLALFTASCALATQLWVVESPRWLLASGDAPRALAALRQVSRPCLCKSHANVSAPIRTPQTIAILRSIRFSNKLTRQVSHTLFSMTPQMVTHPSFPRHHALKYFSRPTSDDAGRLGSGMVSIWRRHSTATQGDAFSL